MPRFFDEAEHGVVRVAALLRRQPERRLVLAVHELDRHRRERDPRQREVDGEDGPGHELVGVRHAADRVAYLLREVGDRLDAGIRQHRHRHREREVRPGRRDAPVDVVHENLRVEHEHDPDGDEQELGGEVDDGEEDVEVRRLLDADDVQHHEKDHDHDPDDDVPRVLAQRVPEDREVVRDEEGRRRDRGDVDEHLRPRGAERHRLVEGVAGEARGAARLGVAHRALGVGRGGAGEDQAGDDEDDRREAEREDGRDAERVVDRGADVAVRGGEQRRSPENALQTLLSAPSPRHRRTLALGCAEPHEDRHRRCGPGGLDRRGGAPRRARADRRRPRCRRGSRRSRTATTSRRSRATARSRSVLQQCGIKGADLLIACTSRDESNLIAAMFAKKLSPDTKAVARTTDEEYLEVWRERQLDVDLIVSSEHETAHAISRIDRRPRRAADGRLRRRQGADRRVRRRARPRRRCSGRRCGRRRCRATPRSPRSSAETGW